MMRTSMQPLAHLVDAAAAKWVGVEHASAYEQRIVREEITRSFRIGDRDELTFHGRQYLLTIFRAGSAGLSVSVHEIAQ